MFESVSENNCLFTKGNFFYQFSGYGQTNGNRRVGFTCLFVTIEVDLRVESGFWECVPPSENQFGFNQEIERLESAWGMESPFPPPITPFADTSPPVTLPPLSPRCSERTPESRWRDTSTAPKEKRLTRVEQSLLHLKPMWKTWSIFCVLGCYIVTVELQLII